MKGETNRPYINRTDMGLLKTKSGLGLKLADVAWSTAVLAPLVVTYWRGTWDLLDDLVS